MNTTTRNTLLYRVVVSCVIVVLLGWFTYQYSHRILTEQRQAVEQQLLDSERRVIAWYQNPADIPVTYTLPKNRPECSSSERIDYESVLQGLGTGLSSAELIYLLAQFDRCGTKITERYHQVLLLTQLELRVMDQLISQLAALPNTTADTSVENMPYWYEFADALKVYVELQINLDELQRSLIVARLNQEPVDGEEITGLLQAVSNLRVHLSEQKQMVDNLFSAIAL